MMKKELSPEQIEQLFVFVRSKYVRYVDCQYELVDHLASAIEEEMELDEHLDFNQALNKVYSRFPVTGFTNFMSEKEKAMRKYWSRKIWHFFRAFLQPPQILIFLALLIGSFYILYNFEIGYKVIYGIILMMPIVVLIFSNRIKLLKLQENLLVVKQFIRISSFAFILAYVFVIFNTETTKGISHLSLLYATMTSTLFIWAYGMLTAFPKMIQEELEQKYAHIDYQKVFAK